MCADNRLDTNCKKIVMHCKTTQSKQIVYCKWNKAF